MQIQLGTSPGGFDTDGLRRVRQLLESPADRFAAELLWLHSDSLEPLPNLADPAIVAAGVQILQAAGGFMQIVSRSHGVVKVAYAKTEPITRNITPNARDNRRSNDSGQEMKSLRKSRRRCM